MTTKPPIDWENIVAQKLEGVSVSVLPPNIKLPALPVAVTQFMEKSKDPDVTLKDLAKIIETDSGLTLELLRYLNSSFVGLRHKATSVLQGLSLLGQRQSTMFLVTTGMEAAIRARKSKLINQASFWNSCLQKALFARELAKLLQGDEDVAFAGGMLADFLLPILTNDLYDNYLRFTETRGEQPETLIQFEKTSFQWDHAIVGGCLARRWYLPDELVCCILMHHRGLHMLADAELRRTSVAAVALSSLLPDQLRQHYTGLEQLVVLQEKWPSFDLEKVIHHVDELHAEAGTGVKNDFPLSRRCQPIIDRFREKQEDALKAEANTT